MDIKNLPSGDEIQSLKEAAEKGDVTAQFTLGEMYHYGKEIERDVDQAAKYYKMAAKQGDYEAKLALGFLYLDANDSEENINLAKGWFLRAAQYGDSTEQTKCLNSHKNLSEADRNYKKAFELYKKEAESGHLWACMPLANMYWRGLGTEKDREKAKKWLKKSVEEDDDLKSILNLIYLYTKSANPKQGFKMARLYLTKMDKCIANSPEIKEVLDGPNESNLWNEDNKITDWFYNAAKLGNEDALLCLIKLSERGFTECDGIIPEFLEKIANNGNAKAQYAIGKMYFYGESEQKDYKKAEQFFLAAVNNGLKDTYFDLGNLYKNALHDYPKGLLYFTKALEYGDIDANLQLGQIYDLGLGVEPDWKKAEQFYRAAEKVDIFIPYSEYFIGSLYERGNADFPKDMEKAIQHYMESARYKYEPAVKKFKELGIEPPNPDKYYKLFDD